MKYPTNWVSKYQSDSGNTVDDAMKDENSVPLLRFWYEDITTSLQQELPEEDVTIEAMTPLSIKFKVTFDSLEDPASISLGSGTE